MSDLFYWIADDVFSKFPNYVRGVVLAFGVKNRESPPDLINMIRDAESLLRERINKENLVENPAIESWRDAFRAFGAKPAKYRSSIEAMARRVLNGNEIPSINTLVDIGNFLSLKHLVPTGGHALDDVIEDIALRTATGDEHFKAFGSDEVEHPGPGEIIFTEGNTVLTRRWSWRQADHTSTLPTTTSIEFNIDGLPPVSEAKVQEICRETMLLIENFCGGRLRFEILSRQNPKMKISE